ncbi:hypothetical protein V5F77_20340 [Xanthobacter sp. DSM 24535]|uniref:hypothetical protein n=1 Tax=Roseixanthobacter psychrophilus TaxID=3119917 RepID=UPI00372C596D
MRQPVVIRLDALYARRAPAARRMAKRGYVLWEIAACLRLSRERVHQALAGHAANGRVWSQRERNLMARAGRAQA